MATPYDQVYDFFLRKISDYSFLNLTEADLETQLEGYLISSITHFKYCKKDLSDRDEVIKQFNETLSDEEKDILSILMIVEYLRPKINTTDLIRQTLTDRDFKMYSQANHLDQLMKLYDQTRNEAQSRLIDYTYYNGQLDELK